jgi:hypothetical protein
MSTRSAQPAPQIAYAVISPDGELCPWSVRSTSRQVRDELSQFLTPTGWKQRYREGWRVCQVAITANGFPAYRR